MHGVEYDCVLGNIYFIERYFLKQFESINRKVLNTYLWVLVWKYVIVDENKSDVLSFV
jgi:hypothetical protein